ncbi:putative Dol-P-Glc:Glc(2)Man(9)GlcNAc(2)-PP-Dol alpha-1,2-glucosyltransferase [Thoreauomyces humboldtii]|nr:putative Dol-P-Glc:Glc(2)Man(9)GlcNAc(2)-PP-Dol alpha-1,2-glucosyltransferase [Thoreauomyces humboldtii]
MSDLLTVCLSFISATWGSRVAVMTSLWPYACAVATFIAFVFWNGSIVLGDKTNHVATLHIPQLYYFVSTAAGLGALTSDISGAVTSAVRSCRVAKVKTLVVVTLLGGFMCWTISRFTIEHPFLLADNRHYSFYIWKNIYRRRAEIRYALVPAYIFAAWTIGRKFAAAQPALIVLLYTACTSLTLVPTPLLDFRYYVVPYLIYRVHANPPDARQLFLEIVLNCCVNVATLYLFGERTFEWPSEPGVLQRFMW